MVNNKNTLLWCKSVEVAQLTRLVEQIEQYCETNIDESCEIFNRLYSALIELWFKYRMRVRETNDPILREEYEIDVLYIQDALKVLKLKFKGVCKLEENKDEYDL